MFGAILRCFAWVFGYILKFWNSVLGNYGLAVILFSITTKVLIFPLLKKQQESTRKSQELQPKLQALQEKYKNDQEKMTQEYQKFMQENKFNPFGGCLLMIFQMFMLIGVLYVVTYPMKYMDKMSDDEISNELKTIIVKEDYSGDEEKFVEFASNFIIENSGDNNVKKATTKYPNDSTLAYIMYYKSISRYHELRILKSKYDLNLCGINLGDITLEHKGDLKLWIFPILTTVFYYLSLWMVSRKQKQAPKMKDENGNEIEMPNMLTMNITMPLLSGWISASVPQSMGLYWFINSFLQIIIQLYTDMTHKKDDNKTNNNVIIEAKNLEKETEEIEDSNEEKKEKKNKDGSNINSSKKKKKNKKK